MNNYRFKDINNNTFKINFLTSFFKYCLVCRIYFMSRFYFNIFKYIISAYNISFLILNKFFKLKLFNFFKINYTLITKKFNFKQNKMILFYSNIFYLIYLFYINIIVKNFFNFSKFLNINFFKISNNITIKFNFFFEIILNNDKFVKQMLINNFIYLNYYLKNIFFYFLYFLNTFFCNLIISYKILI